MLAFQKAKSGLRLLLWGKGEILRDLLSGQCLKPLYTETFKTFLHMFRAATPCSLSGLSFPVLCGQYFSGTWLLSDSHFLNLKGQYEGNKVAKKSQLHVSTKLNNSLYLKSAANKFSFITVFLFIRSFN